MERFAEKASLDYAANLHGPALDNLSFPMIDSRNSNITLGTMALERDKQSSQEAADQPLQAEPSSSPRTPRRLFSKHKKKRNAKEATRYDQ